jgi:hypothetical protein
MLVTADMRLAMARLAGTTDGVAIEVLPCGPWVIQVVHIPVGFVFSHHTRVPTLALVLAGLGTVAVHDWRATLLAGQVFSLEVDQRLNASAEGDEALILAVLHADTGIDSELHAHGASVTDTDDG